MLPRIESGETLHLSIPSLMTATPPGEPSLTATVAVGGSPIASTTLPLALGTPPRLQTGCRCDAGSGGLALAAAALAIARALQRRGRAR